MTEADFISKLVHELEKYNVPDRKDIIEEYRQHFAFMIGEGHTEEEAAALLGNPEDLAIQFVQSDGSVQIFQKYGKTLLIPLSVLHVLGSIILFVVFVAAVVLCFGFLSDIDFGGILPPHPYWCGAVYALTFASIAVLSFCGMLALVFHGMRILHGDTVKHSRIRQRLRKTAVFSVISFAVCFILSYTVSVLSADSFAFWHAWHWFGYGL